MDNELKYIYHQKFLLERLKIRYLHLRSNITSYSLENCISSYDKIGLTEKEIECIKERANTYFTCYIDFDTNQKQNFPDIYKN